MIGAFWMVFLLGLRTFRFDFLFGLEIHLDKSSRFQIGHRDSLGAEIWLQSPLKLIFYLGVQLETAAVSSHVLGDERAETVKAKLFRVRALPHPETRWALIPAYLQGLCSEGVNLSKRATQRLSTVTCQAWWGPTLHLRNWMRSPAHTLWLLGPLHRLAPPAVHLYGC